MIPKSLNADGSVTIRDERDLHLAIPGTARAIGSIAWLAATDHLGHKNVQVTTSSARPFTVDVIVVIRRLLPWVPNALSKAIAAEVAKAVAAGVLPSVKIRTRWRWPPPARGA